MEKEKFNSVGEEMTKGRFAKAHSVGKQLGPVAIIGHGVHQSDVMARTLARENIKVLLVGEDIEFRQRVPLKEIVFPISMDAIRVTEPNNRRTRRRNKKRQQYPRVKHKTSKR